MGPLSANREVFQQLQKEILSMQGLHALPGSKSINTGLGSIERSFPGQIFPTGAIHEFVSRATEDAAATNGFITGLLSAFMRSAGACLWISTRRTLFPPGLKAFGIAPERIIFIDLDREKEALWTIEEALKCNALAAVIGELSEVDFTESRRLQLAVEQSHVTGFIHRYRPRNENQIAAVSRWKIAPLASAPPAGLPGVGAARWNVQLLKVRNGTPGSWQIEWTTNGFRHLPLFTAVTSRQRMSKTG